MFRWKRLRFLWSLSRKERSRWCLKHYRERDYRDECPECRDTTRAERNRIFREMAYYNLALRDRELADNLLETGGLPEVMEEPLNRLPNAVQPGDFVPDNGADDPTEVYQAIVDRNDVYREQAIQVVAGLAGTAGQQAAQYEE